MGKKYTHFLKKKIRKLSLFEWIVLGLAGMTLVISLVGFLGLGQVIPWALMSTGIAFSNMALYVPFLFMICVSMFMISAFGIPFNFFFLTMIATVILTLFAIGELWSPLYHALGLTSPILSVALVSMLPAIFTLSIDFILRLSNLNVHTVLRILAPESKKSVLDIVVEALPAGDAGKSSGDDFNNDYLYNSCYEDHDSGLRDYDCGHSDCDHSDCDHHCGC